MNWNTRLMQSESSSLRCLISLIYLFFYRRLKNKEKQKLYIKLNVIYLLGTIDMFAYLFYFTQKQLGEKKEIWLNIIKYRAGWNKYAFYGNSLRDIRHSFFLQHISDK